MAQPTPYIRQNDFSQDEANNVSGRSTVLTAGVDAELDAVATTLAEVLANLVLVQRDDGALMNLSVGLDQLKTEVTTGLNVATSWATTMQYVPRNAVWQTNTLYYCKTAHTSGAFATDLASGFWAVIVDLDPMVQATKTSEINATASEAAAATSAADAQALVDLVSAVNMQGAFGNILSPLLSLPFMNSLSVLRGLGAVTFSRAATTTANTYIDRYGVFKTAGLDVPRFEKEGLLLESDGLKRVTTVTLEAATETAAAATAPDGTVTASKLVADATASVAHRKKFDVSVALLGCSFSIFAKAAEYTYVRLEIVGYGYCHVSLVDGSVTTDSRILASTVVIWPLVNGWFRVGLTGTFASQLPSMYVYGIPASLAAGGKTWTGDGTSGIYLWGDQMEYDYPQVTSYMYDVTPATGRFGDICQLAVQENNVPETTSNFTVVVDVIAQHTGVAFNIYGGVGLNASKSIRVSNRLITAELGYTYNSIAKVPLNKKARIAYVAAAGTVTVFLDGVKQETFIPANPDLVSGLLTEPIVFGKGVKISNFRVYDQALTDAEMKYV